MHLAFAQITDVFNVQLKQTLPAQNEMWASSVEAMFLAIYVHALSKIPYEISRGSMLFEVPSKNPV